MNLYPGKQTKDLSRTRRANLSKKVTFSDALQVKVIEDESEMSKLDGTLLHMYENSLNTDVNIQVKWKDKMKCFKTHRIVLAIRSPVFADEFSGKHHFSLCTFVVEGVSPRIIEILLWYIYSNSLITETIDEIICVAKVAKYYQIGGITTTCKHAVTQCIPDLNNVCKLLDASIYFELESLREKCIEIIQKFPKKIIQTSEFIRSSYETVSEIVKQSSSSVAQNEIMEAVFRWLQHNKRANRSILSHFNLSSIPREKFLDLLEKFPFFLKTNETISILSNMLRPGIMELPSWYKSNSKSPDLEISISLANIVENAIRIDTNCKMQLPKSSLFGNKGFEGITMIMLKQTKDFCHRLNLTMFELAFGSNFVPEDKLNLKIYSYVQRLTETKERPRDITIHSTPDNYYIVFNETTELQKNFPLVLSVQVEAVGLKGWRRMRPISDERYRVMEVHEDNIYRFRLISEKIPIVCLSSLSDWLVFVDPITGSKQFIITAFYFDNVSEN